VGKLLLIIIIILLLITGGSHIAKGRLTLGAGASTNAVGIGKGKKGSGAGAAEVCYLSVYVLMGGGSLARARKAAALARLRCVLSVYVLIFHLLVCGHRQGQEGKEGEEGRWRGRCALCSFVRSCVALSTVRSVPSHRPSPNLAIALTL
jgi:hypothetical protein